MKKTAIFLMMAVLGLTVLAGCSQPRGKDDADVSQFITPYVSCDTIEEMAEQVGFSIEIKDPDNFTERTIQAYINTDPKMADVDYYFAGDEKLNVRKAPGKDDISGVYEEYDLEETVDGISLKGYKDSGLFYLATWYADDYTYSIFSTAGMTEDDILNFAANVK